MLTEPEIARVLTNAVLAAKRLPAVRMPTCENVWSQLLAMAPEDDGWPEDKRVYEPLPLALIADLDRATNWLAPLHIRERRLMWMRGDGDRWAHIGRVLGITTRWCQKLWHRTAAQIAARDQTGSDA